MSEELLTIERPIGEIVFPFNYEVQKQTPLDRRTLASSIEELTDPDFPYYYRGIMVAMFGATPSADDGIYTLEGADHTNIDNWVKTSTIKTSAKVLAGDAIRIEDVEENGIISKKIHVEIGENANNLIFCDQNEAGDKIGLDARIEMEFNQTTEQLELRNNYGTLVASTHIPFASGIKSISSRYDEATQKTYLVITYTQHGGGTETVEIDITSIIVRDIFDSTSTITMRDTFKPGNKVRNVSADLKISKKEGNTVEIITTGTDAEKGVYVKNGGVTITGENGIEVTPSDENREFIIKTLNDDDTIKIGGEGASQGKLYVNFDNSTIIIKKGDDKYGVNIDGHTITQKTDSSKALQVNTGKGLTSDSNGVKLNYGETIVLEESKVEVKHNNTLKRSEEAGDVGRIGVNHGDTISKTADGILDVKHDTTIKQSTDSVTKGQLSVNHGTTIKNENGLLNVNHGTTIKNKSGLLNVNHGNTISTNASTGTLDVKHDKVSIDAMENGTLYVHTIDGGTF